MTAQLQVRSSTRQVTIVGMVLYVTSSCISGIFEGLLDMRQCVRLLYLPLCWALDTSSSCLCASDLSPLCCMLLILFVSLLLLCMGHVPYRELSADAGVVTATAQGAQSSTDDENDGSIVEEEEQQQTVLELHPDIMQRRAPPGLRAEYGSRGIVKLRKDKGPKLLYGLKVRYNAKDSNKYQKFQ